MFFRADAGLRPYVRIRNANDQIGELAAKGIHSDQLYALSDLLKLQAKQITTLTEKLAEQYKRNAEIASKVALLSHIVEEHLCQGLPEGVGLSWGDDTDDDEDE